MFSKGGTRSDGSMKPYEGGILAGWQRISGSGNAPSEGGVATFLISYFEYMMIVTIMMMMMTSFGEQNLWIAVTSTQEAAWMLRGWHNVFGWRQNSLYGRCDASMGHANTRAVACLLEIDMDMDIHGYPRLSI